jgi:hypothetical protein
VRIAGRPATVLHATETELLVRPEEHVKGGSVEVETAPGLSTATSFELGEGAA